MGSVCLYNLFLSVTVFVSARLHIDFIFYFLKFAGRFSIKACIDRGMQVDIDNGIAIENELFAMCFGDADQKEGMTAFIEKRTANFKK